MVADVNKIVYAWFKEYSGDGDFLLPDKTTPYSVIGPSQAPTRILFCTKPGVVSGSLDGYGIPEDFGLVGRYGFPNFNDTEWLLSFFGDARIYFVGDMDPVDLSIFAALRERLAADRLTYLGISDALILQLKQGWPESSLLPQSVSEWKCFEKMENVFPDCGSTIGHRCYEVLSGGRKLELEAIRCKGMNLEFAKAILGSSPQRRQDGNEGSY